MMSENESELLDCDDAIFLTSSDSAASALLGYAQEEQEMLIHSPELCDRSLSLLVELALLPSPHRVTYEHAAPFGASEFPLTLRNELSAL